MKETRERRLKTGFVGLFHCRDGLPAPVSRSGQAGPD